MRDRKFQNGVFSFSLLLSLLLINFAADTTAQNKKKVPYYSIYANQVMHVRLNDELNSEKARVGDRFTTTLVDPVYSKNGVLLAPQGSIVSGQVTNVLRAQKNGKPATLDVLFTALRLPNGVRRTLNGSLTELDSSSGKGVVESSATICLSL